MSVTHGGAAAQVLDPSFDPYLNEKQASQLLGLSLSWLQRKRVTGGGPAFVKLDNCVRYRKSRLITFMNDRERASTSEYKSHQKAPSLKRVEF